MKHHAILSMVDRLPGHVGLYIKHTGTGEVISLRESFPVEAASVIKLTIMAEAFRQREEGLLDFARSVTVPAEAKYPSCGALSYLHDDITVQVRDLVTLMIILSDNTATNLLIDMLGKEQINQMIVKLGLTGTVLNRKLFMPELSKQGIQNAVTAGDMGRLMEMLLAGQVVSKQASDEMLGMLLNQRLNGKMPFYLHSKGIRCAHKTGEDDGVTHDVGVIYGKSPIVFCFVSEQTDVPLAERVLQDIAKLVLEE